MELGDTLTGRRRRSRGCVPVVSRPHPVGRLVRQLCPQPLSPPALMDRAMDTRGRVLPDPSICAA